MLSELGGEGNGGPWKVGVVLVGALGLLLTQQETPALCPTWFQIFKLQGLPCRGGHGTGHLGGQLGEQFEIVSGGDRVRGGGWSPLGRS